MKKKVLPLAIAAAMAAPGFASAADVSGFTDIIYTLTDDAALYGPDGVKGTADDVTINPNEGKFSADGEVDFSASPADGVTVRVDVDLDLSPGGGSADLEQAFFAWGVTDSVTVLGGVFNNPIGHDAEDAPDMDFTSHGHVYEFLDDQTVLAGNNVAGVAVAAGVGPATVTVGLLNDLQQSNEENSVAVVFNMSPMEGLDLEIGNVSEADAAHSSLAAPSGVTVESVTNFNVVYSAVPNLVVGIDYSTYGKLLDTSYDFWAGYTFGKTTVKARLSSTEAASGGGGGTYESTTIHLSHQIASNLSVALEQRSNDEDAAWAAGGTAISYDSTLLEFIGTF